MITVIGQINCGRCKIVQNILKSKNIPYQYKTITNYSPQEQDNLIKEAEKYGEMSFPIITNNGIITTLKEAIK
jgi:glutaredoxin